MTMKEAEPLTGPEPAPKLMVICQNVKRNKLFSYHIRRFVYIIDLFNRADLLTPLFFSSLFDYFSFKFLSERTNNNNNIVIIISNESYARRNLLNDKITPLLMILLGRPTGRKLIYLNRVREMAIFRPTNTIIISQ